MMYIYDLARSVPAEAKKQITAGRLKGFTDINPMWRIKRLTEIFGPCGIGWWYEITREEIIEDDLTKQKAAVMDILLYYKHPKTGEVSHGIPGTGGSALVTQESKGPYFSDEAFKMALTDAISVAAKNLGLAADVYFEKDRSKYAVPSENDKTTEPAGHTARPIDEMLFKCKDCGTVLKPVKVGQKIYGVREWVSGTEKEFGRPLCIECRRKAKAAAGEREG